MDAKLKVDWLAALRGGEFLQGARLLKSNDGRYCCLGVLVHIQGEDLDSWPDRMKSALPSEFAAGLRLEEMIGLANRNDGSCGFERHTFEQVADYIEKNL